MNMLIHSESVVNNIDSIAMEEAEVDEKYINGLRWNNLLMMHYFAKILSVSVVLNYCVYLNFMIQNSMVGF